MINRSVVIGLVAAYMPACCNVYSYLNSHLCSVPATNGTMFVIFCARVCGCVCARPYWCMYVRVCVCVRVREFLKWLCSTVAYRVKTAASCVSIGIASKPISVRLIRFGNVVFVATFLYTCRNQTIRNSNRHPIAYRHHTLTIHEHKWHKCLGFFPFVATKKQTHAEHTDGVFVFVKTLRLKHMPRTQKEHTETNGALKNTQTWYGKPLANRARIVIR